MTRQRILSIATKIFAGSFVLLVIGFIIPQQFKMPVEGATRKSYSQNSFWAYPWGKSVTHKGVDIFAKRGTDVHPATGGIVLYRGKTSRGGNVVFILGPKWRIHYYAHLDEIKQTVSPSFHQKLLLEQLAIPEMQLENLRICIILSKQ